METYVVLYHFSNGIKSETVKVETKEIFSSCFSKALNLIAEKVTDGCQRVEIIRVEKA